MQKRKLELRASKSLNQSHVVKYIAELGLKPESESESCPWKSLDVWSRRQARETGVLDFDPSVLVYSGQVIGSSCASVSSAVKRGAVVVVMIALAPTWALREVGSEASLVCVVFMGDCP